MKNFILFILTTLLIFGYQEVKSQDTLRITQYNLLYYGLNDAGCDTYNNNIGEKTDFLKTIISYLKPDIFAVNEINADVSVNNYHDYLLGSVFLYNGFPNYDRGEVKGNYLTSQIYYNTTKLTLKSETEINSWPRDIHVYKFYYNSPNITTGDTVFFTYYLAHLKAGSSDDDIANRNISANEIMSYINYQNTTDNFILSGDLNLYTNTEGAYQRFTNYSNSSINLIDPVLAGIWHDNETFADIHTQSAFYSTYKGCGAGGGMDDRFDFILHSQAIENNTSQMSHITNSYWAVGQDGQHFNSDISYNGNNSVPSDVLNALANNSDHLPVYSEFLINQPPATIQTNQSNNKKEVEIAIKNKTIEIKIINNNLQKENIKISIYDLTGRKIQSTSIKTYSNQTQYNININNLNKGIYILHIRNQSTQITNLKFLLN